MEYYDYYEHPFNSRWRFDEQLCDINNPRQLADHQRLVRLHQQARRRGGWFSTFQQWYIWELCKKDSGSIAFIKDRWLYNSTPLENMRAGCLWDPQFALNEGQAEAMEKLRHVDRDWSIHQSENLLAMGSTRILRSPTLTRLEGHEYREGLIVTLPELISSLGRDYTAMEIMHWWTCSPKLACKREHPWRCCIYHWQGIPFST